jgi:hypothetical protein
LPPNDESSFQFPHDDRLTLPQLSYRLDRPPKA